MITKQILKAVEDVKAVLYEEGNDEYNKGIDDCIEAILRHLGLFNKFNKGEK